MLWVFALIGLVSIVVVALVVVGRETARLSNAARPAVFDLSEAVDHIADRLEPDIAGRLSLDDVRWVLLADADLIEDRTREPSPGDDADQVVDDIDAVARILALADGSGRDLADEDVVAVLDGRNAYLQAIGAVGAEATGTVDRR
ncbi:MAG: hypothetical protein ACR2LA_00470 [Acidimicrobiales bacterium]